MLAPETGSHETRLLFLGFLMRLNSTQQHLTLTTRRCCHATRYTAALTLQTVIGDFSAGGYRVEPVSVGPAPVSPADVFVLRFENSTAAAAVNGTATVFGPFWTLFWALWSRAESALHRPMCAVVCTRPMATTHGNHPRQPPISTTHSNRPCAPWCVLHDSAHDSVS